TPAGVLPADPRRVGPGWPSSKHGLRMPPSRRRPNRYASVRRVERTELVAVLRLPCSPIRVEVGPRRRAVGVRCVEAEVVEGDLRRLVAKVAVTLERQRDNCRGLLRGCSRERDPGCTALVVA